MTQHPIVADLSLKGMPAREIHDDIVVTLGPDAVSYSSVTRYLREARFPLSKPEPHPADVQRDLDDSGQAILAALEDSLFASVQQLSRLTLRRPSIAALPNRWDLWRFTLDGRDVFCQMRKRARESICRGNYCECLMLEVQRDRAWHNIITLDESWSYVSPDYEFVWLPRDEKVPEREQRTIQSRKFMLMIVWNPRGFYLMKVLEKGRKFNTGYYIAEILESWSQWRSTEAAGNKRKLLVHADNAPPHTAKLST
jgi:hypothetical protein